LNPLQYPPGGTSGVKEPIKGRKMTLWNRAEGTNELEGNEGKRIMEGKASSHPGKGKEIVDDSNPEEEHSPSPAIRTQMVLPVKEFPHFEGTKREDVISFIWRVDEIAQGACWKDKEWVLTMANLLGGRAAPLARWIRTGLSVGQPIDRKVVVHHLLEAYGDDQTLYAAYEKLEQCCQQGNEKVFEFKICLEELFWTLEDG